MIFVVAIGDKSKIVADYNHHKSLRRGRIFDRSGVLVATDLKTKSLYVSSILIKDKEQTVYNLSKIFPDLSYREILKKISDNKKNKHWILIRRNLTPNQVSKVQSLRMAGLIFEDDMFRVYPQKSVASHYAGYVDLDRRGLSGIEMQYDASLSGGKDVAIAMDVRVQDILHNELKNGMEQYRSKAAAGLVIDVNSGEVIAMSSFPDFDANLQSEAGSEQRFNRVSNGVYELGSIMKIFTNAIAFEHNLVKSGEIFNVRDPIKYGRFTIRDDHTVKDQLTVEEVFAYSSNIGTIKIAERIGVDRQKKFLDNIGFLNKLNLDFPGLGRSIYPKLWREINLYTISYGHGIAITPLHLASAVTAMVNGGIMHNLSFLKLNKIPEGKRVIKEKTSSKIRDIMRKVVEDGTGKKANIVGYEVCGKTGTAERAEFGGYNSAQNLVSFVAAFPASKPKYLVYVLLDRPNYLFNTGGMVAAPVAGKVIAGIAPILGIKPKLSNLTLDE